ncbi:MAG: hypothetical protein AB7S38_36915 [Vulcanimicrobiota bacterium]
MQLKFDPWNSDFGPSVSFSETDDEQQVEVETESEYSESEWTPISCEASSLDELVIVDGVRRVDAHLRLEGPTTSIPVLVGTYAAGGIFLRLGQQSNLWQALRTPVVERVALVLGEIPSAARFPAEFQVLPVMGQKPERLTLELQQRMRLHESLIAAELAEQHGALVLADGPLQNVLKMRGAGVVGYIKSHRRMLLPDRLLSTLHSLPVRTRTPIVLLKAPEGSDAFERFTWYLRLAAPAPHETGLAGIVRLEVLADLGLEAARERAQATAGVLPRLVGGRHRDARSPQNLAPIAALEKELRHRMGDAALVTRILRKSIHGRGVA